MNHTIVYVTKLHKCYGNYTRFYFPVSKKRGRRWNGHSPFGANQAGPVFIKVDGYLPPQEMGILSPLKDQPAAI